MLGALGCDGVSTEEANTTPMRLGSRKPAGATRPLKASASFGHAYAPVPALVGGRGGCSSSFSSASPAKLACVLANRTCLRRVPFTSSFALATASPSNFTA